MKRFAYIGTQYKLSAFKHVSTVHLIQPAFLGNSRYDPDSICPTSPSTETATEIPVLTNSVAETTHVVAQLQFCMLTLSLEGVTAVGCNCHQQLFDLVQGGHLVDRHQ
jgi:hypothetical protein